VHGTHDIVFTAALCVWEGNLGLASHRPCVTDMVVHPPISSELNDLEWKMRSTPLYAPKGHGTRYLILYKAVLCVKFGLMVLRGLQFCQFYERKTRDSSTNDSSCNIHCSFT